jgi:hypothetical protein
VPAWNVVVPGADRWGDRRDDPDRHQGRLRDADHHRGHRQDGDHRNRHRDADRHQDADRHRCAAGHPDLQDADLLRGHRSGEGLRRAPGAAG